MCKLLYEEEIGPGDEYQSNWDLDLGFRIFLNSVASVYFCSICFMTFIFCKYVLMRSKCKRHSMISFYLLMLGELAGRLAILLSLNFMSYYTPLPMILSAVTKCTNVLVGALHCRNLIVLISDLKTISCLNDSEYKSIRGRQTCFTVIVSVWAVLNMVTILTVTFWQGITLAYLAIASLYLFISFFMLILNWNLAK